jgi:hypothetical protein
MVEGIVDRPVSRQVASVDDGAGGTEDCASGSRVLDGAGERQSAQQEYCGGTQFLVHEDLQKVV